jgi:hypothetical protein
MYYLGNLHAEQYSCDKEIDPSEFLMASSAPSKTRLGHPREDVEDMLMLYAMVLESEKSDTEFEEANGFGYILGEVREWEPFQESFDELVSKGCSPYILLRGLDFLLRNAQQPTTFQLPGKRKIRSLERCLCKGAESILAFEKEYEEAHRTMVVSHFVRSQGAGWDEADFYHNRRDLPSQAKTPCLVEKMLSYAEMLRAWSSPRVDALKTYASVHNCVYAKAVTGSPQLSIVAKLNSSFLGDSSIDPDKLRKNLLRFERRNRKFRSRLVRQLNEAHRLVLPVEPFDWQLWSSDITDKSK